MRRVLLVAALAACSKTNPNYCAEAPLHNCSLVVDAPVTGDTIDLDAPVGCTPACEGTTPVCHGTTCGPCASDGDCMSGVCRADGSCADETMTLYASPSGGATAACTPADPCSLATAITKLDTTHTVIHLAGGTYAGSMTLTKDAAIVGRGAIVERSTAGAVVTIGAGRTVSVEGLTLRASMTSTGVNGVAIQAGATATLTGCEIGGTEGTGISMVAGGSLTVARSRVHDNLTGGLQVGSTTTSSRLDLTNTFVYANGGSSTTQNVGGVAISGNLLTGSRIDYVTVVENGANANASAHSGGIVCDISSFAITNSLIAANTVGGSPTASNANTFGLCATTSGDLVQQTLAGLALTADYHLGAGSLAESHAVATQITIDYDGDMRPQGAGYDSGADEYKP